jgi:hypothetical protein
MIRDCFVQKRGVSLGNDTAAQPRTNTADIVFFFFLRRLPAKEAGS